MENQMTQSRPGILDARDKQTYEISDHHVMTHTKKPLGKC